HLPQKFFSFTPDFSPVVEDRYLQKTVSTVFPVHRLLYAYCQRVVMQTDQGAEVWTNAVSRFEPGRFCRCFLVRFRNARAFGKMFQITIGANSKQIPRSALVPHED